MVVRSFPVQSHSISAGSRRGSLSQHPGCCRPGKVSLIAILVYGATVVTKGGSYSNFWVCFGHLSLR